MRILHAGLLDGKIYFWGEKPEAPDNDTTPVLGKPGSDHPFDLGQEELRNILAETLFDGSIRKEESQPVAAWLPTGAKGPVLSNPLLSRGTIPTKNLKLAPWKVSAFNLEMENTIGFLSACQSKDLLTSGVAVGADLHFLGLAVRFAGSLVARQEYLPGIVRPGKNAKALWEPIFMGQDAAILEQLIRSMPHACGALSDKLTGRKLPTVCPGTMVRGFIVEAVDYLVRYSIFSQPQATWPRSFLSESGEDLDSLHDMWMNALVSEQDEIAGPKAKIEELEASLKLWRKPVAISSITPFRLCLALEEPAPGKKKKGSEDWFVHYYLQSINHPEILIPADNIWNPTPAEMDIFNRDHFDAKEYLLFSLGQASTICHKIEDSLRGDAPIGYTLKTQDAYEFLTQRVYALEQAGFGTITPEWWRKGTGAQQRLGTKALVQPGKAKKKGAFTLDHILNFDWRITLGGDEIKREELQELAKSKTPLVRLRGHWIELGEKDVEQALKLTSQKAAAKGSLREVLKMSLGSATPPGGFRFEGVEATDWVADFLEQLQGDQEMDLLKPPKGFLGKLRPYQLRGMSWLHFLNQWGLGTCLADDMGLGKTVQALALIQHLRNEGLKTPSLIICPTSLTSNWQKEAQRFVPDLPVLVHHGVNRNKGDAFQKEADKYAIIISSYSLLHRDIEILKKINWGVCVLDEAQNIKNPKTKQARAAASIEAGHRIALTGTPVENHVGDLWSIMDFLNQGFLGTQAEFKRRFLMPIQAGHDKDAVERLRTLTTPFILRRLKSDTSIIRDLPGKMEMKVYCNLSKEQAALYQATVQEVENTLDATDGIQRKGLVLATLTRLKQICNHPAHFLSESGKLEGRSGKLARLTEMLEEIIEVDEFALVFTQYVEMGKIIQQHLLDSFGIEVPFMHGGVPKKKRDHMIERFQDDEDAPHIFVLSLKTGGSGLNLTRANHVFHYDRWWNPAVENQATDRVHRIGQKKQVQIHKFLCGGTLEERIDEMIERKKGLADSVVSSGESWLTELSTGELKKLFELQKDAVGE